MATLQKSVLSDGTATKKSLSLKSEAILNGTVLTGAEPSESFEMRVPDELARNINQNADGLNGALSSWAGQNCPSASSGTWDRHVSIDYGSGQVTFDVTLDDLSKTEVEVTYAPNVDKFNVHEKD